MKILNKKSGSVLAVGLTALLVVLTGCGDTKVINGVEYDTYGLFDEAEKRNDNIQYELITGNVVWSIVLIETVAMPIYFIGFSMYEPVGLKSDSTITGDITGN